MICGGEQYCCCNKNNMYLVSFFYFRDDCMQYNPSSEHKPKQTTGERKLLTEALNKLCRLLKRLSLIHRKPAIAQINYSPTDNNGRINSDLFCSAILMTWHEQDL